MKKEKEGYSYSQCNRCGKQTYISHSWLVPDGYDDVDWDFEEWCANPMCPSNGYQLKNKMNKTTTERIEEILNDTKFEYEIEKQILKLQLEQLVIQAKLEQLQIK